MGEKSIRGNVHRGIGRIPEVVCNQTLANCEAQNYLAYSLILHEKLAVFHEQYYFQMHIAN